jgi:VWFA-related protein
MLRTSLPGLSFLIFVLGTSAMMAQEPASAPGGGVTLRANANLVIVDVAVTDKQGHAVHGLKQGDFSLMENKSPQTIKSFDEHVSATAAVKAAPKLPAGVFSNEMAAPVNNAVNVLLLDTLNTPLVDQAVVRKQLLDYLDKSKSNGSVAIFGLNTRLIMLQDFSSDVEVLKRAVRMQKNGKGSPLLAEQVSGNDREMSMSEQMRASEGNTDEAIAHLAEFEAVQQSFALQVRAKYTLDALNQLARYLSGLPGRKNLVWFSGSFPVVVLPENIRQARKGANPFAGVADASDEFRRTIDLLSQSQVAIYPVYAKGSVAPPMFGADNGGANGGGRYTQNPGSFNDDQTAFFNQTAGEHTTMLQLAEGTGGEAFVDTNSLGDAFGKAVDHGSNFYTLAYTPVGDGKDGDVRNIQVNVQEKGYTLAYRRSYLTADVSTAAKPGATDASVMQGAMKYGAPPATQIVFKVRVLPVTGAVIEAKKDSPAGRGFAIDYLADASAIVFERTADGGYKSDLDYVACVYDLHGALVNAESNKMAVSFTKAQYALLAQRGLPFHQEIAVPAQGEYVLRVAIHDHKADHIGAVEMPLAKVENLPGVPSAAKAAAKN